jgi:hypothetical protein
VQTFLVGSAIHGHSFYAHLFAGAYDAQGYFATVGDKYFFEHER